MNKEYTGLLREIDLLKGRGLMFHFTSAKSGSKAVRFTIKNSLVIHIISIFRILLQLIKTYLNINVDFNLIIVIYN